MSGHAAGGTQPGGEKQAGKRRAGEERGGEKQADGKRSGEKQSGKKRAGEKRSDGKRGGGKRSGEKPASAKRAGEERGGEKRAAPFLEVGFHTGGFNSAYYSFRRAVEWARDRGVQGIECGFVDGVAWNHGLGYFPHIASWEDPREVREMLDRRGVRLSQLDAAFPMSRPEGPSVAVPYVISAIRWSALAGCPMVDTTDGLEKPEGYSEEGVLASMREGYARIMEAAERYGITVTIETHGYFTGRPEYMERMLDFVDSPLLQMTFDTGNVYIAGQDPPAFLRRFADRVGHVHVKDVAPALSASSRGKQSGIGMSRSAIGEGENAENITACLQVLKEHGFRGAVSLECDAAGGPVMERSLEWFGETADGLGYAHDYHPGGSGK